jgi:hypothetical protein
MNTTSPDSSAALEDRFGQRVAARLSAGSAGLSHEAGERLRAARAQAVARRKAAPRAHATRASFSRGGAATLGVSWWTRIGSVLPLVALIAGLMAISAMQDDHRADKLAAIDSVLLTDDLPPAAYVDPGFVQFLKTSGTVSQN